MISTIRKYRPDILEQHEIRSEPISEQIPEEIQQQLGKGIEGFGELTAASFYTGIIDPTNWYLKFHDLF